MAIVIVADIVKFKQYNATHRVLYRKDVDDMKDILNELSVNTATDIAVIDKTEAMVATMIRSAIFTVLWGIATQQGDRE